MGFQLNQVADPRLRQRIQQALDAAYELKSDLKQTCHETDRELPGAESQSAIRHEPLAKNEGKAKGARRICVRVTSYRSRLLDSDNLCAKALVDELRYCGLIPDDTPQDIELTVTQEKCDRKEERTEIEILP